MFVVQLQRVPTAKTVTQHLCTSVMFLIFLHFSSLFPSTSINGDATISAFILLSNEFLLTDHGLDFLDKLIWEFSLPINDKPPRTQLKNHRVWQPARYGACCFRIDEKHMMFVEKEEKHIVSHMASWIAMKQLLFPPCAAFSRSSQIRRSARTLSNQVHILHIPLSVGIRPQPKLLLTSGFEITNGTVCYIAFICPLGNLVSLTFDWAGFTESDVVRNLPLSSLRTYHSCDVHLIYCNVGFSLLTASFIIIFRITPFSSRPVERRPPSKDIQPCPHWEGDPHRRRSLKNIDKKKRV